MDAAPLSDMSREHLEEGTPVERLRDAALQAVPIREDMRARVIITFVARITEDKRQMALDHVVLTLGGDELHGVAEALAEWFREEWIEEWGIG